jgi:hypothetical protein
VTCPLTKNVEPGTNVRAAFVGPYLSNLLSNLNRGLLWFDEFGVTNNVTDGGGEEGIANVLIDDVFIGSQTAGGTLSVSTTVAANSNRMLCVCTGQGEDDADNNNVASIARDGQSLTSVITAEFVSGGQIARAELWCLVDPNTGTANTVISYTAVEPDAKSAVVYSLYNAAQELPSITGSNTGAFTADGTSAISNINTTVDASLLVDCLSHSREDITINPGVGQTEHADFAVGLMGGASSTKPATLADSHSMSEQFSAGVSRAAHTVLAISPVNTPISKNVMVGGTIIGGIR